MGASSVGGARCFIRIGTASSETAVFENHSVASDLLALLHCVLVAIPQLIIEENGCKHIMFRLSGYVAMMRLHMFDSETFATAQRQRKK